MHISDIGFSLKVHIDKVSLSWKQYDLQSRYLLVKRRISVPNTITDGNRVYIGSDINYEDYNIINGEIYYYRLFVLPDPNNDLIFLTDNKCVLKAIALKSDTMVDYSKYLYDNLPMSIRYADEILEGQNKPLRRFMKTFCFPFNMLDTYADAMLNQIDISNCDETYLPYHAKWLGRYYDSRFGPDLNRLLLETLEEAEPYMGTKMGLEYILQRVFKIETEIVEEGEFGVEIIRLKFCDDDRHWLATNPSMAESIFKIITMVCPMRLNISIKSILVDYDRYETIKLSDCCNDKIIHYVHEEFDKTVNDLLNNFLITKDIESVKRALEESYDLYRISDIISDKVKNNFLDESLDVTHADDAIQNQYTDEDETVITRIRPFSLICSECLLSDNFYIADR